MIVAAEGLSKCFAAHQVFSDVSLEMGKGTVLALCGPSGCGKTTIIKIISGLIGFDSGSLTIGAKSILPGAPYPKELYGRVGVVFQEHNLFPHMTAIQNVEVGLRRVKGLSPMDARDRAAAELQAVGLSGKEALYPAALSGGERQRVAIARAVAMDPLLLLLDEPTSGLDPFRIGDVLDTVRRLASNGTTMLLVTHNLSFARKIANRFAVFNDGALEMSDDPSLLDSLHMEWT